MREKNDFYKIGMLARDKISDWQLCNYLKTFLCMTLCYKNEWNIIKPWLQIKLKSHLFNSGIKKSFSVLIQFCFLKFSSSVKEE